MRHAKPTAGAPAILRPFTSGAEAPTVLRPARHRTPALPCISGAARGHAAASTPETSPALGAAAPPERTSANRAAPPTCPTGAPSLAAPGKSAPVAAGGVQWRHGAPSQRQLSSPIKRILRDIRPRARVLALVSGKGGVGKTNLAVNLAIGLAAAGQRVLLVDADLGLANVDLLLGQRPRGDLGHVLAGRLPLEEIVQEGVAGIRWIPGASHIEGIACRGDARREAFLENLSALETRHDFVLFDGPAGLGPGVLNVARQADELILVTTPEPPAMMDAYATLKAAAATGAESLGQVRLIVNMVTHRRDAERVHKRLSDAAGRFLRIPVELLGYVFCDGHVGRAVQKQEPLVLAYPHSQAAWCVRRLVEALLESSQVRPRARFGFFRRLADLFLTG